jgi:hypothetical protein
MSVDESDTALSGLLGKLGITSSLTLAVSLPIAEIYQPSIQAGSRKRVLMGNIVRQQVAVL